MTSNQLFWLTQWHFWRVDFCQTLAIELVLWLFWWYTKGRYLSNLCHQTSTLVNLMSSLKIGFCYQTNTLINQITFLKVTTCYLIRTLTNTYDKTNNHTREEVNCVQLVAQLLITRWHSKMTTTCLDKKIISDRYFSGIFFQLVYRRSANLVA